VGREHLAAVDPVVHQVLRVQLAQPEELEQPGHQADLEHLERRVQLEVLEHPDHLVPPALVDLRVLVVSLVRQGVQDLLVRRVRVEALVPQDLRDLSELLETQGPVDRVVYPGTQDLLDPAEHWVGLEALDLRVLQVLVAPPARQVLRVRVAHREPPGPLVQQVPLAHPVHLGQAARLDHPE